jgi:nucleotide-binding universal stress UspA family protein
MTSHSHRILVAVDGSDQSLEAVRYIGEVVHPGRCEVVLFHTLSRIPETFFDAEKGGAYAQVMQEDSARWEKAVEAAVDRFMSEARRVLTDKGVPEEDICVKVQERKIGIARDILAESLQGYQAVVVGRTGLSKYKDFVIGSIANKVVDKLLHVSICIVGGRPMPGKVLLALDESEGSMKAVDFVGSLWRGSNWEVTLLHVVRGFDIYEKRYEDIFDPAHEREWIEAYEIESVFEEAKAHLVTPGFSPDRVTTKVVPRAASRAGAILQEAQDGGYGTIVLGRRGLSKVWEFSMGRVCSKVVDLAREHAVWLVSDKHKT